MFGIGETELVLILAFAFMVFGPDKLPGMGRTLGRALRQFRNAQEGFTQVVQTEIVDPATEAMSDNPKRPNRNRSAEFEEDADIELPEGEQAARPKRAETFAERKKRLAAEKAAERAAAEAATAAAQPAEGDVPEDGTAAEGGKAAPAAIVEEAPAPKPRTAADLYAMSPRRKAAAEEAESTATDAPAKPVTADASESTSETGKEAGSEQA